MKRALLLAWAALMSSLAATPAAAQTYVPAVWFSGGSFYYAAYDAPGNYCCGRIFSVDQIYGNIGPAWPGAYNALGDPLQFGTRFTNWVRSVGLEYVNTYSGNTPAHIVKFFLSDGQANFNSLSCWQSGCGGNNLVLEFCCVPNDGIPRATILTYNTYDPWSSSMFISHPSGGGPTQTVYPFVVWQGGQGQPFVPDMFGGGGFYQGVLSPDQQQYAGPGVGGLNAGTDFFHWTQWDTGVLEHPTISQGGNTSTYPFNSESGAQWAPLSLGSYLIPEDYTMGPE